MHYLWIILFCLLIFSQLGVAQETTPEFPARDETRRIPPGPKETNIQAKKNIKAEIKVEIATQKRREKRAEKRAANLNTKAKYKENLKKRKEIKEDYKEEKRKIRKISSS